jgi:3-phosphoshikimate 1-carboxyvinyltransferase
VPRNSDVDGLSAALRALGFGVEERGGDRTVSGGFRPGEVRLDLGDNGTGARCLLALAALRPDRTVVDGSARLRARPFAPLCEALRSLGAQVEGDSPPIAVRGPLGAGTIRIHTDLSSQFATALILIVDRVKGLRLKVEGQASFAYVALTAHVLRKFRDPFVVEPDFSSAGALAVGAATTGGDLLLEGLNLASPQPDARLALFLNRAGAKVTEVAGGIRVVGGPLRGIRANVASCPDLAPLLGVIGVLAEGETVVEGAPHLVHKESDRIRTTVAMVRALGGTADPLPGGFRVLGGRPLQPAPIDASGDHRIAMAGALLALSVPGVTVAGSESVAKSYPSFFRDLDALTG